MTVTTRVGASMVKDDNGRWVKFTEATAHLADHYIRAGINNKAVNAFGERIATYGYTQAGARGSAPKWFAEAKANADAYEKARADEVMIAVTKGLDPVPVVEDIGRNVAMVMAGVAASKDLKESGALLAAAADYQTKHHGWRSSYGGAARKRIKLEAGAGSAAQRLYQAFHKGRSKSRVEMRKAVAFKDFKARYAVQFASGKAGAAAVRAQMAKSANAAQRAYKAANPTHKYFGAAKAAVIRAHVLGLAT